MPGSPRRSRLVTPSDDLRAHHPAGCYSWVASRPDSAGSAGWSRREALALAGAGSQPPWELDLRRSLRLRQTSSPPRFQAERPGDHDGGEHYAHAAGARAPRDTPSSSKRRVLARRRTSFSAKKKGPRINPKSRNSESLYRMGHNGSLYVLRSARVVK